VDLYRTSVFKTCPPPALDVRNRTGNHRSDWFMRQVLILAECPDSAGSVLTLPTERPCLTRLVLELQTKTLFALQTPLQ
jgi:hypothetical protein